MPKASKSFLCSSSSLVMLLPRNLASLLAIMLCRDFVPFLNDLAYLPNFLLEAALLSRLG